MKRTTYLFVACSLLVALTVAGCGKSAEETLEVDVLDTDTNEEVLEVEEDVDTTSDVEEEVSNSEVEVAVAEESTPRRRPESTNTTTTTTTESAVVEKPEVKSTSVFVDGSYSASGSYSSPAGPENVSLTVTLAGDVIKSVNATGTSDNPISKSMISAYTSALPSSLVGKKLQDAVAPTVLNGSSLTSTGFNNALKSLKSGVVPKN